MGAFHAVANHFEAKKHAYRQTQDGVVISFVVHPNDVSAEMAMAPLGMRYMVAFAEIGDDEVPVAQRIEHKVPDLGAVGSTPAGNASDPVAQRIEQRNSTPNVEGSNPSGVAKSKTAFKDMPLPQQAGIRCSDALFCRFIAECLSEPGKQCAVQHAEEFVRGYCGVDSRSDLSTNHEAANKWRKLESHYQSWLADRQYGDMQR
jgi:hypothetical protein